MPLRDKVTCNDCGKELQRRGLSGHRRFVHGAVTNETKAPVPEAVVATVELATGEKEEAPASGRAVTYGPWKTYSGETRLRFLHIKPAPSCPTCGQPTTHWTECSDCDEIFPSEDGHRCKLSFMPIDGGVPLSTLTDISAVS